MRTTTVVIALLLLLTSAVHAASVEIGRPRIQYLSDTTATCKTHSRGCTTITADFFCGCGEAGGTWTAHPRLIARPIIYLTTDVVLRHEMMHLADIHASLKSYAASLLRRTFDSEEACTAFVDGEARLFAHTMALIQRETTIRRDGVQFADRSVDR